MYGTHRIEGGPPAGIFRMPSGFGDLTKSTNIKIMTRHGNRSTRPSGMEKVESPLSRMRRRKKPNRGAVFSARRDASSNVSSVSLEVGSLLVRFCRNPILIARYLRLGELSRPAAARQVSTPIVPRSELECRGFVCSANTPSASAVSDVFNARRLSG